MGGRFPGLRCSAILFTVGLAPSDQGPTVHSYSSAPPGPAPPATARHASLTVWSRTSAVTARSARPPCSTWDGTSPSTARPGLCCASASRSCSRASRHSASNPWRRSAEAEARRITARLLQRQGEETTGADWETLDVASVCDSDGRCVGVEHAALAALDMLGLPGLFDELGFNRRQRCCALANIIARMAHPGSERATNRWLRATSATGELLALTLAVSATWRSTGRRICFCSTRNGLKSMSLARRRPSLTWRRRSHSMI